MRFWSFLNDHWGFLSSPLKIKNVFDYLFFFMSSLTFFDAVDDADNLRVLPGLLPAPHARQRHRRRGGINTKITRIGKYLHFAKFKKKLS